MGIDVEDVRRKVREVRLVVFCNPHNPTGQVFTKEEILPLV